MQDTVTYEQWCEQSDLRQEIGMAILLSDRMAENAELVKRAGRLIAVGMARGLWTRGLDLPGMHLWEQRDITVPGVLYHVTAEGEFSPTPDQYLSLAYEAWVGANSRVDRWERTSLWGYLKHWAKRSFRAIKERC